MSSPTKSKPGPLMAAFGTSLMDRVNVFFKLRRYIKMVAERWVILALSLAVGGGAAIHRVMTTPDEYQATSEIGIAPKLSTPQSSEASKAKVLEDLNSFNERQIAIMGSEAVRSNVMYSLRDSKIPRAPVKTWALRTGKANNITMTVQSGSLDYAKAYAAAWANEFLGFRDLDRQKLIDKSAGHTREEVDRLTRMNNQAREDFRQFQETNQVYNEQETMEAIQKEMESNQAKYNDLETQIRQLTQMSREEFATALETSSARKTAAKAAGAGKTEETAGPGGQPADVVTSDPLAPYESSIYPDLKRKLGIQTAERERLSQFLKDRHPHMIHIDAEIASLNQSIRLELTSLEERRKARIESLQLQANTYPPIINDLKQKLFGGRNLLNIYTTLREKEADTRARLLALEKELELLTEPPEEEGTFMILSAGVGGSSPVGGNKRNTILTGFLAGLAVGLGIIYTLGRLDDRLELAEEVEAELEEPVLGQIPLVDKQAISVERVMITRLDEHSMFAESIRGVRSAVMLGMQGGPKQVMLVTSAVPGDGKTTFTVNFAVTLAIAGNRVLLVDADLRRGNVHGYFDLPRDPGYSEVLQGELHWRDAVQKTEVRTLQLLSSGKLPPNPGELLMGSINRQFIEEIRQSFDYVVFDCPPLTAIDDTFSLVGSSDGMLFVVRSGQTSMRFASGALDAVRKRGAHIMGLILNGITADNPYYYYKNYYHEYYNKGAAKPAGLTATPLPSGRMPAPKEGIRNVASIEDQAQARAGREHLVGAGSTENSKALQFRAIRAAKKLQAAPAKSGKPEENA